MKAAKPMMIGAGLEGHTSTYVQPLPSTNFLGPWLGSSLMWGPCISNFGSFDDVSWCFMMFQSSSSPHLSYCGQFFCLEPLPKDELSPSLSDARLIRSFARLRPATASAGLKKYALLAFEQYWTQVQDQYGTIMHVHCIHMPRNMSCGFVWLSAHPDALCAFTPSTFWPKYPWSSAESAHTQQLQ